MYQKSTIIHTSISEGPPFYYVLLAPNFVETTLGPYVKMDSRKINENNKEYINLTWFTNNVLVLFTCILADLECFLK